LLYCRECLKFKTAIPVKAKRHARGHGSAKKRGVKRSQEKKFSCSRPGCDRSFARITDCDKHYELEHKSPGGSYKCWECSTVTKNVVHKNMKQYRAHLQKIKKHSNRACKEIFCEYCEYSISKSRNRNMVRHINVKHGNQKIIKELLAEIIVEVVDSLTEVDPIDLDHIVEVVVDTIADVEEPNEQDQDDEEHEQQLGPKTHIDKEIDYLEKFANCEYEQIKQKRMQIKRDELIKLGFLPSADQHLIKAREKMIRERKKDEALKAKRTLTEAMDPRRSNRLKRKVSWRYEESDDEEELEECEKLKELVVSDDREVSENDHEKGRRNGVVSDKGDVSKDKGDLIQDHNGEEVSDNELEVSEAEENEMEEEDKEEDEDKEENEDKEAEETVDTVDRIHVKKQFTCDQSKHSTTREIRLRQHMLDMHTERTNRIPCTRCKDEFATMYEMVKHRTTCIITCPYADCTWSCKRAEYIPGHMRRHLQDLKKME
jgi:hypothetical protein